VSRLADEGGLTDQARSTFSVEMSEALSAATVNDPGAWDLREAGVDGQFETPDDVVYSVEVSPAYGTGTTVSLLITDGPLGDGEYRLRKLIDVYEWALERLPFKVGDEAIVVAGPFKAGHGFAHYNDLWETEPTGEILDVHFSDGWVYSVRLDVGDGVHKVFTFGERYLWKPAVRLTYGQDAP